MRGALLTLSGIALVTLALGACATGPKCEIEVVGVEKWNPSSRGLDVEYRVKGMAGLPGTTWLIAKNPSGEMVPGYEVELGAGPFQAVIGLKLTGVPKSFIAMLEMENGARCKADIKNPGK